MVRCKLRINREGEFEIPKGLAHSNQCGKIGQRNYRYFISIEATNECLTPEGYVMENAWCDDYFKNTYSGENGLPPDSCENMAMRAIDYFVNLFEHHEDLKKVKLTRILVRIHGTSFSYIEAEWNQS